MFSSSRRTLGRSCSLCPASVPFSCPVEIFLLCKEVEQSKLTTVKALQSIGFETIASGDSYNDLGMIQASKAGFLFRSTDKIKADYPQIPAYETYEELLGAIKKAMEK